MTVNWTHRTQTIKVTTRADTKVGLVYLLLSGAFAALALVCIFTPTLFLKAIFGDLGAIISWLNTFSCLIHSTTQTADGAAHAA